jgi:hypothetical protein
MGKLGSLKIIAATVIFLTFFDVCFSAVGEPAMPRPMQTQQAAPGGKNPRYQTRDEKLQQLKQESTAAVTEIDANYTKIIGYVNTNQTPAKIELNGLQKTVMRNKKYLMVLDDSQKSIYHVLSAWVIILTRKMTRH